MEQKQIDEGNKLIALFMASFEEFENDRQVIINDIENKGAVGSMQYHKEWDWIMPVVDQVESIELVSVNISVDVVEIFNMTDYELITRVEVIETKIIRLWIAIVQFIQWYNKQK